MSPEVACGSPVVPSGTLTFVCALMSAPRASSSLTTAGWFSRTAHIKRRLPADALLRVDRGAAVEQQRDGVHLARSGGGHQRGFAARDWRRSDPRRARNSASIIGGIAVDAGEVQRRHAVAGRGVDLGAGANQQLRRFDVVRAHGPVQRRRAVGLAALTSLPAAATRGRPRDPPAWPHPRREYPLRRQHPDLLPPGQDRSTGHPVPFSAWAHFTPWNLFPSPVPDSCTCSLHPDPCTLIPAPDSRFPIPDPRVIAIPAMQPTRRDFLKLSTARRRRRVGARLRPGPGLRGGPRAEDRAHHRDAIDLPVLLGELRRDHPHARRSSRAT